MDTVTGLPVRIPLEAVERLFDAGMARDLYEFLRICTDLAEERGCKIGKVIRSAVDKDGNNILHHLIPFCTRVRFCFIRSMFRAITGPRKRVCITYLMTHRNNKGIMPSILAASYCEPWIFTLWNRYRLSIWNETSVGQTMLRAALITSNFNMATWLLEHGARVDELNCRLATPLHMAAFRNRYEVAHWLIERHAGPCVNWENDCGWTPYRAVKKMELEAMVELFTPYLPPPEHDPMWHM